MDENTTTTASANVPSTLSAKSAMRTPEPRRSIGGGGAAGGRSSKRMMHKDLNRLASMGGSPGSTTTTATAPGAAASRNPLSTPVRGAMPSGDVPTTPSASVVPADKNMEQARALLAAMPPGTTAESLLSLHGRVEAQMKTIEGLREENVTMRSQISKQEDELRSSAIAGAELEATNASLQRQLSKTHEERQDLRAQITVLENQLRSARGSEASLTAQVADATLRIAGLERDLATSQQETASAVDARVQATKHHHEEIRIITEEYTRRVAEEHERARTLEESSRRQANRLTEVESDLEDLRQAEQRLRSAERQMGEKQLETLQLVREALESKLHKEMDQRESAIAELQQVLEQTRRESFQHLACAIKLSLCMSGQACNLDIQSLWDTMTKQGVPSAEWNAWISAEFARNAQEAVARERAAQQARALQQQQQQQQRGNSLKSGRRGAAAASASHSINGDSEARSSKRSRFAFL